MAGAQTLLKLRDQIPEQAAVMKVASLGVPESTFPQREAAYDTENGSQQLQDPFEVQAKGEYVVPKYDPAVWAQIPEVSTRLRRCISTYARNTVGLGWYVEPAPVHPSVRKKYTGSGGWPTLPPDLPEDARTRIAQQTETLRKIFEAPNPEMNFTSIMYRVKFDEETMGDGYMEVTRNLAGEVSNLYHAPAVSMRLRRMRDDKTGQSRVDGYVQIRGNKKRFFKRFSDKRIMNAVTGAYNPATPLELQATEVLRLSLYAPAATFYGVPRYVSAAPAISGNRMAGIWNVKFFENDAVPRMAVLVSGGKLDTKSVEQVENFLKAKLQGVEKSHRVLVLQTEVTRVGFAKEESAKIELQPITVGSAEDASFLKYRDANDEEIRQSFGIARIFFTTENVNKSAAYACLTGDTKIPLLDGRVLSLEELTKLYPNRDQGFWVYSVDERGNMVPGWAHSPRVTYDEAPVYELLLDNHQTVRCTANHRFMLRNGTYKRCDELVPGTSLMPWYVRPSYLSDNPKPYWQVYNPSTGRYEFVHRLVADAQGTSVGGKHVQHKDGNNLNNAPENLEAFYRSEHTIDEVQTDSIVAEAGAYDANHKVVSITRCGTAQVYDLTVDEHECFAISDGIISHNSRELTNDQEFEPERVEIEQLLNQTLVPDILGEAPVVILRFERLQITDPSERARVDQMYSKMGVVTPNEIRDTLGKPRFPKEYVFADKPLDIALAEMKAGAALLIQKQGQEGMMQLMQMQQQMQGGGQQPPDDDREKPSGKRPPAPPSGPKRQTDDVKGHKAISLKSTENSSEENVDKLISIALASIQATTDSAIKALLVSMDYGSQTVEKDAVTVEDLDGG